MAAFMGVDQLSVMGVTDHFLIGFTTLFIRQNSCLTQLSGSEPLRRQVTGPIRESTATVLLNEHSVKLTPGDLLDHRLVHPSILIREILLAEVVMNTERPNYSMCGERQGGVLNPKRCTCATTSSHYSRAGENIVRAKGHGEMRTVFYYQWQCKNHTSI